jgi:thiamine-monophosphate kinase
MAEGEFELIARRLRPLAAGHPGALDLTDDAALLDPPAEHELVLTKDAMVEGVHFRPEDPPGDVAKKLLRVNLSDLAAMGAEPLGHLLALARPSSLCDDWLGAFCDGLADDQRRFGTTLLGGDTVSTPGPLILSLTAIGSVPRGEALKRSGAKADDDLWVSGTLGDAALGLRVLQGTLDAPEDSDAPDDPEALDAARAYLIERYRLPRPRLALGAALRRLAHAAIDVSDGLIADLGHVLEASNLGAEVRADLLPLSPAARFFADVDAGVPSLPNAPAAVPSSPGAREAAQASAGVFQAALGGGDDYELLFTAPEARRREIEDLSQQLDLPLTRIGRLVAGDSCRVIDAAGEEVAVLDKGWRHF